jgi:hypothetical protein
MEFAAGGPAGMPFYSSARDRSGILFCRRQKRYKRIARFPARSVLCAKRKERKCAQIT